jgi:hypothetical protein
LVKDQQREYFLPHRGMNMKPRGVKKIFQDEQGRFIALCKDGTLWIAVLIDGLGRTRWSRVDDIPKQDYEGAM